MNSKEEILEQAKIDAIEHFINYTATAVNNKPTAYYIAGQPGSGKSSVVKELKKNLIGKGYPIVIDSDEIRKHHPYYDKVMKESPDKAYMLLDGWGNEVSQAIVEHAKQTNKNIIFDGTFGSANPDFLFSSAKQMKQSGFKTEMVALSLNETYSKIGIHFREQSQIKKTGSGRSVEEAYHDMVYNNIPKNLNTAINKGCFDSYKLFGRDTYKNNSIPLKVYNKNKGLSFLKDFIKERDKPLSKHQVKLLNNYKKTTIKLFQTNNVSNLEKRIETFKKYVDTSISKMNIIDVKKIDIPLTEYEQKLFAALNSSDMDILINNKEFLSENFLKEVCLTDKLSESVKIMGLTVLGVENSAELLNKIIKINSTVKKISTPIKTQSNSHSTQLNK